MIWQVYKIVNKLDGKVYIGLTRNLVRRRSDHRRAKADTVLARAVRKHGWNNFEFTVVSQHYVLRRASDRELALIREHDCVVPKGYNVLTRKVYVPRKRGEGRSKEWIENVKAAVARTLADPERRERIREAQRQGMLRRWERDAAIKLQFGRKLNRAWCESRNYTR